MTGERERGRGGGSEKDGEKEIETLSSQYVRNGPVVLTCQNIQCSSEFYSETHSKLRGKYACPTV